MPDKKVQQARTEKEKLKRRQAIKIQTMIIVNVIIFVGLLLYSYQSYLKYSFLQKVADTNNETVLALTSTLRNTRTELQAQESLYDQQRLQVQKDLDITFPNGEAYTELTRQLDQFFFALNDQNPPIIHNNLRFDEPKLSTDQNYYILPFSMSIQSSKENFERFLDYVDNSGSIGSNIRLMSIQSIQINFIRPATNNINEFDISFTVNMHAYFQNTQINPQS